MPREVNFLLGQGERLTTVVDIRSGSGTKNPPYSLNEAKQRVTRNLSLAVRVFQELPDAACPGDQAVGVLTMHPRYVSKSEFPSELISKVGLNALGSRSRIVKPDQWGIKRIPEDGQGIAEDIFVSGTREAFAAWHDEAYQWNDRTALAQLTQVEDFTPFLAKDKVKSVPVGREDAYFEVALHTRTLSIHTSSKGDDILGAFETYAAKLGCTPLMSRIRELGGIALLPVSVPVAVIEDLAQFSFLRVARGMPAMRPARPTIVRSRTQGFPVTLPTTPALDPSIRAVIFDGGLPDTHPFGQWVNYVEPPNIGHAVSDYQSHGCGVTSAFLFGPLEQNCTPQRPVSNVDHVRVLDHDTGTPGDIDYYDVLDRITNHIGNNAHYEFVGLSIGPDFALDDDDISRWTIELDELAVGGKCLVTSAAGNNGELSPASGDNRVQPPADGVNVLSVGACDSQSVMWQRAPYSGVGPGRSPGIIKPDGVAFGGCDTEPFSVVSSNRQGYSEEQCGTSFAGPYVLRSGVAVRALLGPALNPMTIRALILHRADRKEYNAIEVGWGCFQTDPDLLVTCDNDEALVVYQGDLPVKQHLRAMVPLPGGDLLGRLTISATLVIAPEIDPAHPNAYTRGGIEVVFRPNEDRKRLNNNGVYSIHPESCSFFSPAIMWGNHPTYGFMRGDSHKWEPCQKGTRTFNGGSLNKPVFDIYHHHRVASSQDANPKPISYSLIISVKAPSIGDYYNQVVRQYVGVLQQIQPVNRIQIRDTHDGLT